MTDPDEGLSPQQEAEVRRLLAEARHTEPTPDAVVARLDRVLADLADEPDREATVVRLADRRRRAATMLVAAAASVAAVIGIGQLVSGSGGDAPTATAEQGDAEASVPEASDEDRGTESQDDRSGGLETEQRLLYELSADRFADQADALRLRAVDDTLPDPQSADDPSTEGSAGYRPDLTQARGRDVCTPGAWGVGGYLPVLYDGDEGWVVLRRPQGETQVADLFLCGSDSVARSVTLPYP